MSNDAVPQRPEHDLLGCREVPGEAYWGVHTLRAIENYQISSQTISDYPDLIRAFAQVKKAAALANHDVGKLSGAKTKAIVKACDLILNEDRCLDQFPIDVFQGGAGTSVNMNANEVIANLALEVLGKPKGSYDVINPNDDVNMSQSTNDAYPTAVRIATYRTLERLASLNLAKLQEAFENKSLEFERVLKLGRTQLQDAVPMTLGQEFSAFAMLMSEERRHLQMLATLLLEVNLGATAIGTGINTPSGYTARAIARLAEVTQLPVVLAPNLVEATSDCGAYVSAHAGLKRIAVKLSKICNDLRLLSSGPRAGLAEIRLPERAAGSSIMPAKVNPVIPEVVNQVAFKVLGNDLVISLAAEAGQLQLNAMEPVIGESMFESIALLAAAMDTLREKCVDGIEANVEKCAAYVHNSISIVTFLNLLLGHELCDEIGKECAATGKSVREVVLEHDYLTPAQLDEALNLDSVVVG
ncbi:MAG: aspartate ammonia-lyase [Propionibacteriaceae bacterium]|jgi:aspartate ammonia-lyase|nr:aspartate ammonia-lyase [Propionibacteriaceae bacterium]